MIDRRTWQCSNEAFIKAWPGGYKENFAIYTPKAGLTEDEIVDTCLRPFFGQNLTALEIGCGAGFWVERHLLPNFRNVIGVDVIDPSWVLNGHESSKFRYIKLGEKDYQLGALSDESIDFVWSFGVFCHLAIPSIEEYLKHVFRVLKPRGHASLYFSNWTKRPQSKDMKGTDPKTVVGWTENDWDTTNTMLLAAGFTDVHEVLPHGRDTLALATKPLDATKNVVLKERLA